MSAAKHTPGPFHREGNHIVAGAVRIAVVDTPDVHGGVGDGEAESNIDLFAAAPELLKALQAVLATWDRLYPMTKYAPGHGDEWENFEFREMSDVRAAIKAATGRAS